MAEIDITRARVVLVRRLAEADPEIPTPKTVAKHAAGCQHFYDTHVRPLREEEQSFFKYLFRWVTGATKETDAMSDRSTTCFAENTRMKVQGELVQVVAEWALAHADTENLREISDDELNTAAVLATALWGMLDKFTINPMFNLVSKMMENQLYESAALAFKLNSQSSTLP